MGLMEAAPWPKLGYAPCVNGFSIPIPGDPLHKFRCKNVCHPLQLLLWNLVSDLTIRPTCTLLSTMPTLALPPAKEVPRGVGLTLNPVESSSVSQID